MGWWWCCLFGVVGVGGRSEEELLVEELVEGRMERGSGMVDMAIMVVTAVSSLAGW